MKALDRAGMAYLPVHADDVGAAAGRFRVLVLPNVGALSDEQVRALEAFVAGGGNLIATGETGAAGEFGEARADFALASLFGLHRGFGSRGGQDAPNPSIETSSRHSYLRLAPELRSRVNGPADPGAPPAVGVRHPLLAGLDEADVIFIGG